MVVILDIGHAGTGAKDLGTDLEWGDCCCGLRACCAPHIVDGGCTVSAAAAPPNQGALGWALGSAAAKLFDMYFFTACVLKWLSKTLLTWMLEPAARPSCTAAFSEGLTMLQTPLPCKHVCVSIA